MAEGVFRSLTSHHTTRTNTSSTSAHPLVGEVDSCGTGAYHVGDAPDPRTLAVLSNHGITSTHYSHSARKFRTEDLKDFDYIFAMDSENLFYLTNAKSRAINKGIVREDEAAKVMLFGAFGGKKSEEVGDPYYGGRDGFDVAYEQVERFSKGFIKYLENGEKK